MVCSAVDQFLIVVPAVRRVNGPRVALPDNSPVVVALCILRAPSQVVLPEELAPDSDSVPDLAPDRVLVVLVPEWEPQAWFRLQVRLRGHSAPVARLAVVARLTKRARKAR